MTYGVTSAGFNKKLLATILEEIEDSEKANISQNLNVLPSSLLGQINGIFGDKARELWDVLEAVYNAQYPDSASGAALDGVAAITGAVRLPAVESTVTLIATGDNATVLPIGRQAKVPSGDTFETTAAATIATQTSWVTLTAYSVNDVRTNNDGTDRIYVCTQAGTSGAAPGPQGTGTAISDGTCLWRYLGDGAGSITVAAESVDTGPKVGLAYTISEIVTPVVGWDGVSNLADATLGRDVETDTAFRLRRLQLLSLAGNGTLEAIRSAILDVTDVVQCLVFENTTLVTDGNGVPGKAFEAVVQGGTAAAIAEVIFETKPAGIQAYGSDESESVVDSQGTTHTIEFSRPQEIELFVACTVTTDGNYPSDGDTQVKNAILAIVAAYQIGDDAIIEKLETAPFGVSGVTDLTAFTLDKRPSVVQTVNAETYALSDGQTLTVKVDVGAEQTATFNTGDFVDINNATAAEVAAVISTDITGATGGTAAGDVTITSDAGISIEVTGGTANAVLGFPTTVTPTGTSNISIGSRELASLASTNITVTS